MAKHFELIKEWHNSLKIKGSSILLLLSINIIIRIFHHLIYTPALYHDTYDYLEITNCLLNWNFSNYQAIRPPIYPIVLSLHYIDDRLVWIVQSLMGVTISLLIFFISTNITTKNTAFFIAIVYSLCFNLLFVEAALLSETTTIFFLVLTLYLFTKYLKERKPYYLLQISLFSSLAVLTRPIMIILVASILLSLYLFHKNDIYKKRFQIIRMTYFLLPVLIMILGWSLFNKFQSNYFGITSLPGYNLSNISGKFIERCEDKEYKEIKDIYLKYREKRKTHIFTIFYAKDEIMEKTGLTFSGLSKKLTMLSLKLFYKNPHLYLKSVITSFINYWGAGNVWQPENINETYKKTLLNIWNAQKVILIGTNTFFLISLILLFIKKKSLIIINNPLLLLMTMIIIFSSILQALVEHGENTRYKLPFQHLILIVVIKIIYDIIQDKLVYKTPIVKSYFKVLNKI